ncbi:MAG: beta-lactamase family protein [Bryobacterales bacterium]|nr:beta-lactamase family protein [Bryobacterales bacterium]
MPRASHRDGFWGGRAIRLALLAALPAVAETQWQTAPPTALGLDSAKLETLRTQLAARGTRALIVARRGRIALEWYAEGHDAARKQGTASLAKSLVGGLSLTLLVQDGLVKWDDPASRYIPAWRGDERKSGITLRHLASHTSGLQDAEVEGLTHEQLTGWMGAFWRRDPNPFLTALHDAPVLFEPGTQFHYSNTGMAALSYALTAALRESRAPQQNLRDLLRTRITLPLGIPDEDWSIGYGRAYETDGLPVYASWGGGSFTPRATARIGQLLADGGRIGERVLIRPARLAEMKIANPNALPARSPTNPVPAPAMGWYTNEDRIWPSIPADAFCGAGAGHQTLLVIPSLDLVVVRNGAALNGAQRRADFWGPMLEHLYAPTVAAVLPHGAPAPYPASTHITGVEWAPADEIRIAAQDSDNWPLTWMDDGSQFTSYGDGRGFAPFVDRKLSSAGRASPAARSTSPPPTSAAPQANASATAPPGPR